MNKIFKSMALFTLIAVLLAIWLPNFIIGPTASADSDTKGSTIGGVEIGNLKGKELVNALTNAVNDWYAQPITVSGAGSSIQVSSTTFQFDIEDTVKNYEDHYSKPWYAFWSKESTVHLPLDVQPSEVVKNEISNLSSWNTDLTYDKVALNASYLKTDDIEAVVEDLSIVETDRISVSIETIPESASDMKELIAAVNDTVIEPQASFSFIEKLGDVISLANREAINFIASNIYNAALHMNGEIVERHTQDKVPTYSKPGLEANVNALKNEDLKFINKLTTPVKLKLSVEGENLKTEVYTTSKDTEVSVKVSRDETIQPRTITRFSEELAIGQTEQLQEGVEGLRVSVYRTVEGQQQLVSRDYYPPVNRVLLKSSKQPITQTPSNDVNDASNSQIDLDGDGFPDGDLSGEISNNSSTNSIADDLENHTDEEQNLPPGSYYDKGGNIITPRKGED